MRRYGNKNIILALLILLLSASCEEVIRIDLNSRNPELVVEGLIASDSTCTVRLSLTTDYFEVEEAMPVDDATITLASNYGEKETLTYMGNGLYRGFEIRGVPGTHYNLDIARGLNSITGSSYLPGPAEIISIEGRQAPFSRPGEQPAYILDIKFSDKSETINYYMLRIFRNDTLMDGSISLVSNNYNSTGIIDYSEWRYEFYPADSAKVEVYSIDRDLYSYFSMLNEVTSYGINFSTPYNPGSNLTGNTLGYFGSWSVTSKSVKIE